LIFLEQKKDVIEANESALLNHASDLCNMLDENPIGHDIFRSFQYIAIMMSQIGKSEMTYGDYIFSLDEDNYLNIKLKNEVDLDTKLKILKELRADNVLTEEQYQFQKEKASSK
jgi:hypothetical protein